MSTLKNLEDMLARGQDSAMLRYGLGSAYLEADEPENAVEHARAAVEHDPDYSAAWRLLGKAQAQAGHSEEAAASFRRGIEVASRRGDQQAEKEMRVFLRRLERQS